MEIEQPAGVLDRWLVRVAVHDRREAGGRRIEVEVRGIVKHVERNPTDFDDVGRRQACGPTSRIDVAPDPEGRSESAKAVQPRPIAATPGVNSEVPAVN